MSWGELLLLNPLLLFLPCTSKNNVLSIRNKSKQNKNDKTTRESNTTNNENEIMTKLTSDLQYAN